MEFPRPERALGRGCRDQQLIPAYGTGTKPAGSLQLEIIAEGVETDEQRQFLLSKGCHAMQGYHFYRPVPAEDFGALLSSSTGA